MDVDIGRINVGRRVGPSDRSDGKGRAPLANDLRGGIMILRGQEERLDA